MSYLKLNFIIMISYLKLNAIIMISKLLMYSEAGWMDGADTVYVRLYV